MIRPLLRLLFGRRVDTPIEQVIRDEQAAARSIDKSRLKVVLLPQVPIEEQIRQAEERHRARLAQVSRTVNRHQRRRMVALRREP